MQVCAQILEKRRASPTTGRLFLVVGEPSQGKTVFMVIFRHIVLNTGGISGVTISRTSPSEADIGKCGDRSAYTVHVISIFCVYPLQADLVKELRLVSSSSVLYHFTGATHRSKDAETMLKSFCKQLNKRLQREIKSLDSYRFVFPYGVGLPLMGAVFILERTQHEMHM